MRPREADDGERIRRPLSGLTRPHSGRASGEAKRFVAQRRQRELQLEQARYAARLAQRQYDAVDPDNRLVASELERRWNERLERVARLEQAYSREGSLKTPPNAVAQIHEMAGQFTYADIADRLNAAGFRTAFGRHFTSQHVGYICRRDKVGEQ